MEGGGDGLLDRAASALSGGGPAERTTPRALLRHFGFERRGRYVVDFIRGQLARKGLATVPDLDTVWIDSTVELRSLTEVQPEASGSQEQGASQAFQTQALLLATAPDPVFNVGKFEAANKPVRSVRPDEPLEAALTIMVADGFSYLPVTTGERSVKGVLSWESVARRLFTGGACERASDCMEPPVEARSDTPAFRAIGLVAEWGYALIRNSEDNALTGIVTGADVAQEFSRLAERYLVLNEIENQLRRLVTGRFGPEDFRKAQEPDGAQDAQSAEDLTLGELQRLVERKENWQKLGLRFDRAEFAKRLGAVRGIRNKVMHFDPDPLEDGDLQALRNFAAFVAKLSACQQPAAGGDG